MGGLGAVEHGVHDEPGGDGGPGSAACGERQDPAADGKKKAVEYPQDDVDTDGWAASTPETAKDFSAVAWYFAREIESGSMCRWA